MYAGGNTSKAGEGKIKQGKGKAARWRANTFDYSRQDACAPKGKG